jgi:chromosome segregation ATPase
LYLKVLGDPIETPNNAISSIISMLDELNDNLLEKDSHLDMLNKEKGYLNNLISLNKYDIENLEKEKTNLRKQCILLQEDEYKNKNELQDAKIKLLQYETDFKQNENTLSLKYTRKIDDLEAENRSFRRKVEDLEKTSISTIDHLTNYVNKDYYNSLNEKYLKLEERLLSKENQIKALYQDINGLSKNSMEISFDEHINQIKSKFRQLENELSLAKMENDKLKNNKEVSRGYDRNFSSEELQLKQNLGL